MWIQDKIQICRKICGLGCVTRSVVHAWFTQPCPRILLHFCIFWKVGRQEYRVRLPSCMLTRTSMFNAQVQQMTEGFSKTGFLAQCPNNHVIPGNPCSNRRIVKKSADLSVAQYGNATIWQCHLLHHRRGASDNAFLNRNPLELRLSKRNALSHFKLRGLPYRMSASAQMQTGMGL